MRGYERWVRWLIAALAVTLTMLTQSSQAIEWPLVKGGQADAVIVVGSKSVSFYRWVAGELQSYVKKLAAAVLPIVTDDKVPVEKSLILLGGPQSNPFVAETVRQHQADFTGLKPEGFILKTIELSGRPALVVGGNEQPVRCTRPTNCWSGWESCSNSPATSFPSRSLIWRCRRSMSAWNRH